MRLSERRHWVLKEEFLSLALGQAPTWNHQSTKPQTTCTTDTKYCINPPALHYVRRGALRRATWLSLPESNSCAVENWERNQQRIAHRWSNSAERRSWPTTTATG
jgi:hypothetical protein